MRFKFNDRLNFQNFLKQFDLFLIGFNMCFLTIVPHGVLLKVFKSPFLGINNKDRKASHPLL